jgi:hypothetical protein
VPRGGRPGPPGLADRVDTRRPQADRRSRAGRLLDGWRSGQTCRPPHAARGGRLRTCPSRASDPGRARSSPIFNRRLRAVGSRGRAWPSAGTRAGWGSRLRIFFPPQGPATRAGAAPGDGPAERSLRESVTSTAAHCDGPANAARSLRVTAVARSSRALAGTASRPLDEHSGTVASTHPEREQAEPGRSTGGRPRPRGTVPPSSWADCAPQGVIRSIIRANGMVSRTWWSPQIQATQRSTPMPKPACGTVP